MIPDMRLTYMRFLPIVLAITIATCGVRPWAALAEGLGQPGAESDGNSASRNRFGWYVTCGPTRPKENIGLLGKANYRVFLGFGFEYEFVRHLVLTSEFGIAGHEHTVDRALFSEDPTFSLTWLTLALTARTSVGRWEPFVSFGAGPVGARLAIVDVEPFPAEVHVVSEDSGIVLVSRAGIDFTVVHPNYLGVEFRTYRTEADFGDVTGGKAKVGGDAYLVSYRRTFGGPAP